jgi:hypothetical protein
MVTKEIEKGLIAIPLFIQLNLCMKIIPELLFHIILEPFVKQIEKIRNKLFISKRKEKKNKESKKK